MLRHGRNNLDRSYIYRKRMWSGEIFSDSYAVRRGIVCDTFGRPESAAALVNIQIRENLFEGESIQRSRENSSGGNLGDDAGEC